MKDKYSENITDSEDKMNIELLKQKIDSLYAKYVERFRDIVGIESPTSYKDGVDAVCRYIVDWAKDLGFDVETHAEAVSGDIACITLSGTTDRPALSISGHMDTVHNVGLFGDPTVRIEDGIIYGPGVADCKGGIVAGMLAMEVLRDLGQTDRTVRLLLQSDEENSSITSNLDTINWICEKAKGSALFLNLEPADRGRVKLERKGIVSYKFNIKGVEAHSSFCATAGANAIAEAAYKIIEAEKFKDNDNVTCCCSIIEGGTKPNIVPAHCSFVANVRFKTLAQREEVDRFMTDLANKSFVNGTSCTLEIMSERPPVELCERNIKAYERYCEVLGAHGIEKPIPLKGTGGSDAAYVTIAGIPCIDSVGIVGGKLHNPGEYAELESLKDSALGIALMAAEF